MEKKEISDRKIAGLFAPPAEVKRLGAGKPVWLLPESSTMTSGSGPPGKQKRKWIGELFFYLTLVGLVFGVILFKGAGDGAPSSFFGFSAFTVLSGSMQREIPKGSLVITQHVDPYTLEIGDDITYMNSPSTTVTHRIVGIIENYEDTGQRAFETQGVMNSAPDRLPAAAANVVGKVIFHNYILGQIAGFLNQYWYLVLLFVGLFAGFFVVIQKILAKLSREKPPDGRVERVRNRKRKGE